MKADLFRRPQARVWRAVRSKRRDLAGPAVTAALTALLPTAALPLTAQIPADAAVRVDQIFAAWDGVDTPGCAVGVTKDGLTVFERAYGMADLEHGIPNTPATIFEGGSVSKQFTAAAIMLLVLDGELSLDDDVRDYVPEVPDYGPTITLHHLMTHASGLRDWGSVASISGWGREQRSHDHDDVVDIVSRQSALNFEPGHEYSYSNTGFNLLAVVVSRVSGMPFAQFSKERIFEPLGMGDTQWRDDYRRIVPGRSTAYARRPDGWRINRPIEHVHGNGGILTTVGDLAIWNQALTDGRLGGERFLELMHRRGRLSDGSDSRYAGGLQHGELGGVRAVTHTGSTAGYRAFLGRYPDEGLGVAMLCNASNVSTGGTGARIARVFLGDAFTEAPRPDHARLARDDNDRFAGLYRDPVTGFTRELTADGGLLHDGGTVLDPAGDLAFATTSGRRYVFEPDLRTFQIEDWQYTDQRYERVEPWTPSSSELNDFVGTYHSDDAETTLVFSVQDGGLSLWRRPSDVLRPEPIYEDAFRGGAYHFRFRRDASGRVDGLSLSTGRVYDMRFERTH